MANVNLQSGEAQRIRDAYQSSLGRGASDDEVSNWLSGAYGWGDASNIDPIIGAISNSDEARGRRQPSQDAPTLPTPTYGPMDNTQPQQQVGDWYQQFLGRQGSPDEINNWLSGAYGYGDQNNLDAIMKAIAGSGEALNYRPQAPPSDQPRTLPQPTYGPQGFAGGASTSSVNPEDVVRNAYRQYVGRDASDEEVQTWLSGGYGWGDKNNLQGVLSGIIQSATGKPGYQDFDYWKALGFDTADMFDANGQVKPGWSRTAKGYEYNPSAAGTPPPTGTTTTTQPPGGYQQWFTTLMQGKPSSPQALSAMEAELAKYGIKLQKDSAGNVRGRIFLPDGHAYDVVSQWGQPWTWIDRGLGGDGLTSPLGGSTARPTAPTLPGGQYNDPYTKMLEEMLKSRIGNLNTPVSDPYRDQYAAALQKRTADLNNMGEGQIKQLMDFLQKRFTDLQGPGYTGAENEVWRTQALDPIEQDRSAARKRIIERMAARGHTMESGPMQAALLEVDKAFDQLRGETQTQMASTDLARREGRQQRAETIGAQLTDIPEQRARESLDVQSALEQLSALVRNEQDARSRESLGYAGTLSDLGPQRLQLALQAMGMGGSPESLGNTLFNVAGLNQNAANLNRSNSGNLWSGLGSIAAILANRGQ